MLTDEILIKKEPLMKMFGSGGGIVIGIALVILGLLLKSSLVEILLDFIGWSIIIMGIIAIIAGGVSLFSGKKGRAGNF
jgi:hypothetical protein